MLKTEDMKELCDKIESLSLVDDILSVIKETEVGFVICWYKVLDWEKWSLSEARCKSWRQRERKWKVSMDQRGDSITY